VGFVVCVCFVMCGCEYVWVLYSLLELVIGVLVFILFCIVCTVFFCTVSSVYMFS
jgi:hypothetical protein